MLFVLVGCASQGDRTRTALDAGDPQSALKALNEELGVSSQEDLPKEVGDDKMVFLLDRAMILQQLEQYPLSSRDLEASDKQIEQLDLSANRPGLGDYLFSDHAESYRAPSYEKLMINTMIMMNYLVRSDLNGARAEAARFSAMQQPLRDKGDAAQSLLGPGSYLAGFASEKSGKSEDALRYYDEALAYGQYQSLNEPIRRLAQQSSYSSPRLTELLKNEPEAGQASPHTAEPSKDDAELLVIVNFGRAPAKLAERISLAQALRYADGALSPLEKARAKELALQGLMVRLDYPVLAESRSNYTEPTFALDDQLGHLESALAVDQAATHAWQQARAVVVAAAITHMMMRLNTGMVDTKAAPMTQPSGKSFNVIADRNTDTPLPTKFTGIDAPDTRYWATLPARIAFGRIRVRPGTHVVTLSAAGGHKRESVTLAPGGWAVVSLTAPD